MNVSHRNWLYRVGFIVLMALLQVSFADFASAQTAPASDDGQDSIQIKPYSGPPIYLDEPEVVAAPTLVRRETLREQYDDGKKRVEREVAYYSDNHFEADGTYREFYPNEQLFVEGRFRNGRQDGEWTFYHENGQLNRKATYSNGQPDGAWEVLRADGTLSAKRSFRNGLRHGDWITYDASGQKPLREEHYVDGKAEGVWKIWHANGQQRQQLGFKQGQLDGTSIEWDENGEKRVEVSYADGKLNGARTLWLKDGRKITQNFEDGKLVSQSNEG
jgi:antitoxin component YwqK of YwqJK toxin-antitoxin module